MQYREDVGVFKRRLVENCDSLNIVESIDVFFVCKGAVARGVFDNPKIHLQTFKTIMKVLEHKDTLSYVRQVLTKLFVLSALWWEYCEVSLIKPDFD